MKVANKNEYLYAVTGSVTTLAKTPFTESGNQILGQFVMGRTLGKGTFGKVKLGTHTLTREKV